MSPDKYKQKQQYDYQPAARFMHRACTLVRLFVCLSVCLSPNCKNAIFSKANQFRAMVSIDDL